MSKVQRHSSLLICFLLFVESGIAFNIAPKASFVGTPPQPNQERSSYFGYSVALLEVDGTKW